MKKFIVGQFNYFTGKLIVDQVDSENELDALKEFLIKTCEHEADKEKQVIDNQYFKSKDQLIEKMTEIDIIMAVKEV